MEIRRNNLKKKKNHGFTILEFMVVMGLVGLLVLIAAPTYITMKKNIALNNQSLEILNALRVVQQRSVVSSDNVEHGVRFNDTEYIVFGGEWSSPLYTVIVPLENGLEITAGANSEITFDRLTGASENKEIKVGYPGKEEKVIDVTSTGIVKLQ